MSIKKSFKCFVLASVLIFAQNVFAKEVPQVIKWPTDGHSFLDNSGMFYYWYATNPPSDNDEHFFFGRSLGASHGKFKSNIRVLFEESPTLKMRQLPQRKHSLNYEILDYHVEKSKKLFAVGEYLLQDKYVVGYFLIQRQRVMLEESEYPDIHVKDLYNLRSIISKIESLPEKHMTLVQTGYKVYIYSATHDGYIEQFGIIHHKGQKFVVYDAFYPKAFQEEYEKKLSKQLDHILSVPKNWIFDSP